MAPSLWPRLCDDPRAPSRQTGGRRALGRPMEYCPREKGAAPQVRRSRDYDRSRLRAALEMHPLRRHPGNPGEARWRHCSVLPLRVGNVAAIRCARLWAKAAKSGSPLRSSTITGLFHRSSAGPRTGQNSSQGPPLRIDWLGGSRRGGSRVFLRAGGVGQEGPLSID